MKNILPRLTLALIVGTVVLLAANLQAEDPAFSASDPPTTNLAPSAESLDQADEILTQALVQLTSHESINAKIRQQVDLLGHHLIGDGVYLQSNSDRDRLLRMELKVQVAEELCSLLQVSDGRTLWIEEQRGTKRTVQRIDVRQVSRDLRDLKPRMESLGGGALPLGGLQEWLHSAYVNFQFTHAGDTELAGVPVSMLVGRWRKENLLAMLPKQKAAIEAGEQADLSQLKSHLPQEVVVLLGRDDLFPYLIDYRRYQPAAGNEPPTVKSLLRVQIYEVRFGGPVDLRQFVYQPGPVDVVETTAPLTALLRTRAERQKASKQ